MGDFFIAIKALLFGHKEGGHSPVADRTPVAETEDQSKTTVLAIDDDKEFLGPLRMLLRDEGFIVMSATSGPKGLDMLRFAPKNLKILLLDFNMPGFSGAETLKHVRKLCPQIKIIALTGVDLTHLPPEFSEGVDKLVLKPFKSADLIATIRSLLPAPAATAAA